MSDKRYKITVTIHKINIRMSIDGEISYYIKYYDSKHSKYRRTPYDRSFAYDRSNNICNVNDSVSYNISVPRDRLDAHKYNIVNIIVKCRDGTVRLCGVMKIDVYKYIDSNVLSSSYDTYPLSNCPDRLSQVIYSIDISYVDSMSASNSNNTSVSSIVSSFNSSKYNNMFIFDNSDDHTAHMRRYDSNSDNLTDIVSSNMNISNISFGNRLAPTISNVINDNNTKESEGTVELKNRIKILEDTSDKYRRLYEEEKKKREEYEGQCDSMRMVVEERDKKIEDLNNTIQQYILRIVDIEDKYNDMKDSVHDTSNEDRDRVDRLSIENEVLSNKISTMNTYIKSILSNINTINKEKNVLAKENDKYVKEICIYKKNIGDVLNILHSHQLDSRITDSISNALLHH